MAAGPAQPYNVQMRPHLLLSLVFVGACGGRVLEEPGGGTGGVVGERSDEKSVRLSVR